MKKYWILSSVVVVVVVIGAALLLVFNKDKAGESAKRTASKEEIPVETVSNKANGIPTNKKAEETLEEIKKMFNPQWEKVTQIADKRLSELMAQAQKEYKAKKEMNQDVTRLEGKYRTIFNDFEEDTKTQVDSIISNMQKEVIAKDLNNNIGEEYFELYRIQKEKRIEKVISELKKLS
jgi:hypothetical protein